MMGDDDDDDDGGYGDDSAHYDYDDCVRDVLLV